MVVGPTNNNQIFSSKNRRQVKKKQRLCVQVSPSQRSSRASSAIPSTRRCCTKIVSPFPPEATSNSFSVVPVASGENGEGGLVCSYPEVDRRKITRVWRLLTRTATHKPCVLARGSWSEIEKEERTHRTQYALHTRPSPFLIPALLLILALCSLSLFSLPKARRSCGGGGGKSS